MKKALISPNEIPQYVSGWKNYSTPILSPVPDSARVADVSAHEFQVASPIFWVDCGDNVIADQYYYQTTTKTILPIPAPAPKPVITSTLTSSVDSTATIITVANAAEFPKAGSVKIGNEMLVYHGKEENSLLNVIRGAMETTAADHAVGSTVTVS